MGKVTLDDAMLDMHGVAMVGPIGFAVHVAALLWCSRNNTTFIPYERINTLIDLSGLRFDYKNPLGLPGRDRDFPEGRDEESERDLSVTNVAMYLEQAGLWEGVRGPDPMRDDDTDKKRVVIGYDVVGARHVTPPAPSVEPTQPKDPSLFDA